MGASAPGQQVPNLCEQHRFCRWCGMSTSPTKLVTMAPNATPIDDADRHVHDVAAHCELFEFLQHRILV
jgi:hypothetical protein